MRCELVSLLSQDLESGLFCCQVPKRLLAMCLEFTSLELWDFFGVSFCVLSGSGAGDWWFHRWEPGGMQPVRLGCCGILGPSRGAQGRTQCPQTRAKHCNLCFWDTLDCLGFLCPLSWLLPCAHWFLCFFSAPSSSVPQEVPWRVLLTVSCDGTWRLRMERTREASRVPSLPAHLQSCVAAGWLLPAWF